MHSLVLAIHIIVAFLLIVMVLLQKSKGGAVGGLGGGSMGGLFTARGSANFLTRTTAILATLFFISALFLVILGHSRNKSGVLQKLETSSAISHTDASAAANPSQASSQGKSTGSIPLS